MLLQQLVVGKEVKGRVWHKDVVTLITMKPSLTSHWDSLPTSLDQYHVGTIVPGVVQRIKKFGVFLQVIHKLESELVGISVFRVSESVFN